MSLHLLVALAPIVVALALLALRVPALWAGTAGLGAGLIGALTVFTPTAATVRDTAAQMGPTVLVVALIILGGLGLAGAMGRSGGQDAIATWLARIETGADRTASLLLLVFGLTPFMESVTGFGIGVVITAPLLIRHGLTPVKAVTAGLLGLVSVPWGSLAPGTLVASELAGQDFQALGTWSAVLSLPVLVVSMALVLGFAAEGVRARHLGLAAGIVLVQWGGLLGASVVVGPPLTGVLAAALTIAALLVYLRLTRGPLPPVDATLVRALTPYLVLTAGILLTTGVLALLDHPSGWGWISNPALWLLVAALLAPVILQIRPEDRGGLAGQVLRGWATAGGTAVAFLLLGIVMAATGMAEYLATTAAAMGPGFIAAIPAVGALGGYLTGSNTGAAAMFSTATTTAASGLGASPMIALASQNVTGSYAIIASPPRVALATAVALPPGGSLPGRATAVLLAAIAIVVLILAVVTVALA